MPASRGVDELLAEIETLRFRLSESEETLRAIGSGEVDAFVVSGEGGDRVFTLRGAEHPYRILVETMSEGAVNLSGDGIILYSNSCMAAKLGLPLERLIGSRIGDFVKAEDWPGFAARLASCRLDMGRDEVGLIRADGSVMHALFACAALDLSGGQGTAVVFTDISDLKKAELEAEEEKILLVELLHRVKNTLGQIRSLAKIEAAMSDNVEVKEALSDLEGRVSTISSLYSALNAPGDAKSMRLDLYLAEVAGSLVTALQKYPDQVRLALELEPVAVDPRRASPLGLIVNELVTNALKYAFTDGRRGELLLRLAKEDGRILLEVENDGEQLPKDFGTERAAHLGLTLVGNLARQVGGNFEWRGGARTVFRLDFPGAN